MGGCTSERIVVPDWCAMYDVGGGESYGVDLQDMVVYVRCVDATGDVTEYIGDIDESDADDLAYWNASMGVPPHGPLRRVSLIREASE